MNSTRTMGFISPALEMGAYEAIWLRPATTWKRIADMFRAAPEKLPSGFVNHEEAARCRDLTIAALRRAGVEQLGVQLFGAGDYPTKLRSAKNPVELLYSSGNWARVFEPTVAVVGTRHPTNEGARRTRKLVKILTKAGWAIASGLASGIDTIAHTAALDLGALTFAVIGTPLGETYPKENAALQRRLAREHVVISQVPLGRYAAQDWRTNRGFFPERNKTMSALSKATIIVEAGETSGTLTQARAALAQGRQLFILDSCFTNPGLTWPQRFEKQGAIRITKPQELIEHLGRA